MYDTQSNFRHPDTKREQGQRLGSLRVSHVISEAFTRTSTVYR